MRVRTVLGAVIMVALLAGCVPEPAESGETPPSETEPTGTATPTPEAGAPVFGMPELCADILTADTAAAFATAGLDLLGGPDGLYGENYFGDPTPEEKAGGITCVWGDEAVPASTVIVSVAPVTTSTRSGIVSALIASGLIESQIEGGLTYARIGDEVSAPAELHVIRNDSWISVLEAVGGEDRFQHATELVDEVTGQVYTES
ncbi:hypothetical protein [Pseudolysinimonas yzui]|uniref:Uncharacterized protein n=1 Tax=Pseudolysinimonas yzui TaxID=2708254 RepID=A0A8J3GNC9_9MICO|nr:hypothetical protein [Pseudolysinimonas yzui]GHF06881.1 hypothetical protein GCM10011600_04400 [Pseudolysinimonas yzui]